MNSFTRSLLPLGNELMTEFLPADSNDETSNKSAKVVGWGEQKKLGNKLGTPVAAFRLLECGAGGGHCHMTDRFHDFYVKCNAIRSNRTAPNSSPPLPMQSHKKKERDDYVSCPTWVIDGGERFGSVTAFT